MRKSCLAVHLIVGGILLFGSRANAAAIENAQKAEQQARKSLERILSLDLVDTSLETALSIVSRKGDLKLNYNRSRIPVHKKINLKLSNVTSAQAIQEILKGTDVELRVTASGQLALIPGTNKPPPSVPGNLQGKVGDLHLGIPLPQVRVELYPTYTEVTSDLQGYFKLQEMKPGVYSAKFQCPGYESLTIPGISIQPGHTTEIQAKLTLTPIAADSETLQVIGKYRTSVNPVSAYTFSSEEIQGNPATAGVISRILDTFPGVSFLSDENLEHVIRGGSPLENAFYIDNIEVPGIGHLAMMGSNGGFYSALNPELIQNVEFLSGNFSTDFGDRLSSITRISLKEGNRTRFAGSTDLSLAGVETALEGPLPNQKGSWLISLRKSTLSIMQSLGIELETVPKTFDSQIKFTLDLSPHHKLNVLNFHSTGKFWQTAPNLFTHKQMDQDQSTTGINLTSYWSPVFFSSTSVSFSSHNRADGQQYANLLMGPEIWRIVESRRSFVLRNTNFLVLNSRLKLDFGFQIKHEKEDLDQMIYQPVRNFLGNTVADSRLGLEFRTTQTSLFNSLVATPLRRMTLTLGIRSDYSSAHRSLIFSPRISTTYRITDHLTLNSGIGMFHQLLPLNYLATIPQAVDLKHMRAVHYGLGFEYLNESGTRFSLSAYQKDYSHLPISPEAPYTLLTDLFLDNSLRNFSEPLCYRMPDLVLDTATAYSRGIEALLQKRWFADFISILSISCFQSRFTDLQGIKRSRIYDTQYIFNLVGKYTPSPRWEFSASWVFMGGAPYTPMDYLRSAQMQQIVLDESQYLALRQSGYSRLNIRITKSILIGQRSLLFYLDVINVLDIDNVKTYEWNLWSRMKEASHQLGIVPILGFKYRF